MATAKVRLSCQSVGAWEADVIFLQVETSQRSQNMAVQVRSSSSPVRYLCLCVASFSSGTKGDAVSWIETA